MVEVCTYLNTLLYTCVCAKVLFTPFEQQNLNKKKIFLFQKFFRVDENSWMLMSFNTHTHTKDYFKSVTEFFSLQSDTSTQKFRSLGSIAKPTQNTNKVIDSTRKTSVWSRFVFTGYCFAFSHSLLIFVCVFSWKEKPPAESAQKSTAFNILNRHTI